MPKAVRTYSVPPFLPLWYSVLPLKNCPQTARVLPSNCLKNNLRKFGLTY
nr:MAG TPA: hypothetical protein [Caudoviricetes sp.]